MGIRGPPKQPVRACGRILARNRRNGWGITKSLQPSRGYDPAMRLDSAPIPVFFVLALSIFQAPSAAQEPVLPAGGGVTHAAGVAPHPELDGVYARFARAYDELDSAALGALYTTDALYLPAGGPIQRGREEVEAGFRSFFDHVRSADARLEIGFEILDRRVADGLATDVGIYTLQRIGPNGEASPPDRGKFTVVASRDGDGGWRFHVDAFSPLDGIRPPASPASPNPEPEPREEEVPATAQSAGADETAAEPAAPMEFDTYQLVLLKRPAEPTELPDEELHRIQAEHLAHMGRMAEEGHLVAAGPFGDQENEALRGLALYRVGSIDEARRLAEADPAVQAGRLEVEVMTWYTEKGSLAFPGVEKYRRDSSPEP